MPPGKASEALYDTTFSAAATPKSPLTVALPLKSFLSEPSSRLVPEAM